MKEEIAKRVQQAIAESDLSMSEIGRRLGISPQSVRAWKIGKAMPSIDRLADLARATGKSLAWIQGADVSMDQVEDDDNNVSIPLFNASASAGPGSIPFDGDQIVKLVVVDKQWVRMNVNCTSTKNLSLITASGDSMDPTLRDGDVLFVDTGVTTFRSDSIYVARVNGELFVKRFQKLPNGRLMMISDNEKYRSFELSPDDEVDLIGRVCFHWAAERI